jgi:hypothetical protein
VGEVDNRGATASAATGRCQSNDGGQHRQR